MAVNRRSERTGAGKDVTCLDDVPNVARLAARQQLLAKWYQVFALAPFAALVFVAFKFFPGSNSWTQVVLVFAAVIWALAIAGYAIYLFAAVRCPGCKSKFGAGEKCRSCGLPRHRDASGTPGA